MYNGKFHGHGKELQFLSVEDSRNFSEGRCLGRYHWNILVRHGLFRRFAKLREQTDCG